MAGSIGSPCAVKSAGDWCGGRGVGRAKAGRRGISLFGTSNLMCMSEDTEFNVTWCILDPISGGARTAVGSVEGCK